MRAAILAITICTMLACGRRGGERQLVDVKRGDLVIGVVVTGSLEAVDSTDIKPPAVDMWNFKIAMLAPEGLEVKQGKPVVGFDTSEQTRELETMQNEVEAAKRRLEKKRDDVQLARREEELTLANAEATLRKATLKATTPGELVATVELKAYQLDQKSAEIALSLAKNRASQARRSDEAELANLNHKLNYASVRVAELQKNIGKMMVMAPRAGTIVYPTSGRGEKKKVGDQTWRWDVALQVVALDKMTAKGEVDEIEMARVAQGQPVTLRLDALPDAQLGGKVQSIARAVRAKSHVDPSKVVEIRVELAATKEPLRPGMRFRGEVEIDRIKDVVQLPADAVFVTPEGPIAFRERDGHLEQVKIELGKRSSTAIEVKSGLAAGDRVSRVDPRRGAK